MCCLQIDPNQRWGADQLLGHQFFVREGFAESFEKTLISLAKNELSQNQDLLEDFRSGHQYNNMTEDDLKLAEAEAERKIMLRESYVQSPRQASYDYSMAGGIEEEADSESDIISNNYMMESSRNVYNHHQERDQASSHKLYGESVYHDQSVDVIVYQKEPSMERLKIFSPLKN